jgi:hypothetical protein
MDGWLVDRVGGAARNRGYRDIDIYIQYICTYLLRDRADGVTGALHEEVAAGEEAPLEAAQVLRDLELPLVGLALCWGVGVGVCRGGMLF